MKKENLGHLNSSPTQVAAPTIILQWTRCPTTCLPLCLVPGGPRQHLLRVTGSHGLTEQHRADNTWPREGLRLCITSDSAFPFVLGLRSNSPTRTRVPRRTRLNSQWQQAFCCGHSCLFPGPCSPPQTAQHPHLLSRPPAPGRGAGRGIPGTAHTSVSESPLPPLLSLCGSGKDIPVMCMVPTSWCHREGSVTSHGPVGHWHGLRSRPSSHSWEQVARLSDTAAQVQGAAREQAGVHPWKPACRSA